MENSNEGASSRLAWLALAIAGVAALSALAYFTVPAFHGAAYNRRLVAFITHQPAEGAPAVAVVEDRHMDPNFESDLRGFVPQSTHISVTAVAGDPEALAFAQEIAAWLRANGWQHVQGAGVHPPRANEHLNGTNLQVNPKGGMELIVGPRHDSAP